MIDIMNAYIANTDSTYMRSFFLYFTNARGEERYEIKTEDHTWISDVILVPMLLLAAALYGFSEAQHRNSARNDTIQEAGYDITIGETDGSDLGVRIMTKDLFFTALIILIFTSVSVGLWIYRSVATPLVKLRKATQNIKDGNLDFVLSVEGTDEFSELCRDFEEMRRRLKESAEEKIVLDKENKELISNISHDLKTPITAVKGYVEGIMGRCGRHTGKDGPLCPYNL